jgi:hypothetical protein
MMISVLVDCITLCIVHTFLYIFNLDNYQYRDKALSDSPGPAQLPLPLSLIF